MSRLPLHAEWVLVNPTTGPKSPFSLLEIWFRSRFGFARRRREACALTSVMELAEDRFGAAYQIGAHRGFFEATVLADYSLRIRFIGTTSTECEAYPVALRPRRRWGVHRLAILAPQADWQMGALLVNESVYRFDQRGWRPVPEHPCRYRAALAVQPLLVEEINYTAVDTDALMESLAGDRSAPALPRPDRLRQEARRSGLVTRRYMICDRKTGVAAVPEQTEVRSWDSAFVL